MTCAKNDFVVEMLLADGRPYYTVLADRWECPSCKRAIITGFARAPWAMAPLTGIHRSRHREADYARQPPENQFHFAGDFPREE
jgi:hypothetical protein